MLTNIKLLTNKQTTVSVHDLINRKGYESYFNPFNNNLKFDVEYLGKLEANNLVASGTYYCYECQTEHFRSDNSKLTKLQCLYNKIENKEVY